MKLKTKLFTLLFALAISQQIMAQGVNSKWDKSGDAPINGGSKIGTTNNNGFSIITNNQSAVDIESNGTFNFIKPVNFTNKVKFDSLRVLKYLYVDSIHCRTLKVGNSWTINDAGFSYGGTRPYNQQVQNATDRKHVFEGGPFFSTSAVSRDSVQAVIGFINNPIGPRHRLQVHSNFARSVFSAFTNATTGVLNTTDGFRVGILSNGVAEVAQMENLDLRFLTSNTQRMVIKNTGFVGINTNTPGNQLELNSTLATAATPNGGPVAPTFGPPTGASGLRFSDLNNTSIPQNNTSGRVLSVNAAGDVILVPDGGGSGPAVVTAQNGLNTTFASPAVELGGTLLHNTFIDQAANSMFWHNQGLFTIGNNATFGTALYKLGVYNDQEDRSISIAHNRPSASYGITAQTALNIENTTINTSANGFNFGIHSAVSGSIDNRNVFLTDPTGLFNVAMLPVQPGSVSEAINAVAYHGNIGIGGGFWRIFWRR